MPLSYPKWACICDPLQQKVLLAEPNMFVSAFRPILLVTEMVYIYHLDIENQPLECVSKTLWIKSFLNGPFFPFSKSCYVICCFPILYTHDIISLPKLYWFLLFHVDQLVILFIPDIFDSSLVDQKAAFRCISSQFLKGWFICCT